MTQSTAERFVLAIAIFIGINSMSARPQATTTEHRESNIAVYQDQDAYAIYALFLQSEKHAYPVIQMETTFWPDATPSKMDIKGDKNFRKVWGAALKDYAERYRAPMLLTRAIPTSNSYELLSQAEFKEIMKSDRKWDLFYERYPESGGLITFSPVGFDSDRTHAIVDMGIGCGPLCGHWGTHFFEKMNGKWAEVSVKAHYYNLVS